MYARTECPAQQTLRQSRAPGRRRTSADSICPVNIAKKPAGAFASPNFARSRRARTSLNRFDGESGSAIGGVAGEEEGQRTEGEKALTALRVRRGNKRRRTPSRRTRSRRSRSPSLIDQRRKFLFLFYLPRPVTIRNPHVSSPARLAPCPLPLCPRKMTRGPKKHMKRLNAPKHWMLSKLGGIWAPKPSAGPHKQRECLPLSIILRNRLKYALTRKESMAIVMNKFVKVDGKVRTGALTRRAASDVRARASAARLREGAPALASGDETVPLTRTHPAPVDPPSPPSPPCRPQLSRWFYGCVATPPTPPPGCLNCNSRRPPPPPSSPQHPSPLYRRR